MDTLKKVKASAALIIAFSFIITAVSCAGGTSDTKNDSGVKSDETTVEAVQTEEEIPPVDYNEYEFRFLTTQEGWGYWNMDAETETGDTLNDTTYKRNRTAEDALNIVITEQIEHYSTVGDVYKKTVMADEEAYDAATLFVTNIVTYEKDGQTYPISGLENLSLSEKWWNAGAMSGLSRSADSSVLIGDINLMFYESHYVTVFNQAIIADNHLDNPYDLVADGKWTIGRLQEMAAAAAADIDGDGKPTPSDDRFGICFCTNAAMPILSSLGVSLFSREDGNLVYSGLNDTYVDAYEKVCALFADSNVAQTQASAGMNTVEGGYIGVFSSNRSLFLIEVVGELGTLRGMSGEYGIVVMPKYDESGDYTSAVYHNAIGLCVPVTCSESDRTSYILDYMAKKSFEIVRPAYYDIMLGVKLVRDEKSTASLDIILENGRFEAAYVYGWGDIANTIHTNVNKNNTNIASIVEKIEGKIKADMDK